MHEGYSEEATDSREEISATATMALTHTTDTTDTNVSNILEPDQNETAEAASADGMILCCSRNMCQQMPTTQGNITGINRKQHPCHFGCGGFLHGPMCAATARSTVSKLCCFPCNRELNRKY